MSRASRRRTRATRGKPVTPPHRWAGLLALALAATAVAILTVFILADPPGEVGRLPSPETGVVLPIDGSTTPTATTSVPAVTTPAAVTTASTG